jgi:dienelactone hydrolase
MGNQQERTEIYQDGHTVCEGWSTWESGGGKRPCVILGHDWAGLLDGTRDHARRIASWGYVAFAADVYGQGRRGTPGADNSAFMGPFLADRAVLRARLLAAVSAAKLHPQVDPDRVAFIGFCFGGLCALDLARANAPVAGVVSLHGVYAQPGLGPQQPIRPKVLVCHGWDDPLAKPDDVIGLTAELTNAAADWQLHAYGNTLHAFTSVGADAPTMGAKYSETAHRRSFAAMKDFLAECLA